MGRRVAVLAALLVALSVSAWEVPPGLPGAVPVAAAPAALLETGPVEITGATFAELDQRSGTWTLRGSPVVLTRGEIRIAALQVTYDTRRRVAVGRDQVHITGRAQEVRSRTVQVFFNEDRAVAEGGVLASYRETTGVATLRAQRVEAFFRARRAIATGSVVARRGAGTLFAERIEYDARGHAVASGSPRLEVADVVVTAPSIDADLGRETAVAEGGVRLVRRDLVATGARAEVNQREGWGRLTGNARVRRGQDELEADAITVYFREERVVATGRSRVIVHPDSTTP